MPVAYPQDQLQKAAVLLANAGGQFEHISWQLAQIQPVLWLSPAATAMAEATADLRTKVGQLLQQHQTASTELALARAAANCGQGSSAGG